MTIVPQRNFQLPTIISLPAAIARIASLMGVFPISPTEFQRQSASMHGAMPGFAIDELTGFLTLHSLHRFLKSPGHCPPELGLTLLGVELSRFDLVNIGAGIETSEVLITRLGQRLVRLFPKALAFAKLGDARFGVLLVSTDDLDVQIKRLNEFLQRPAAVSGEIIVANIHVGVAGSPANAIDRSTLVPAVIAALRHATIQNRRVCHFEPAMLWEARKSQILENDLRVALVLKSIDIYDAVNNADFAIEYQPVMNVRTGDVHGFEALMRWRHPRLGQISPAVFVPMAERIGLMQLLGGWIIRNAVLEAMTWPPNNNGGLPRLSINLSGTQFDDADALIDTIRSAFDHAGIDPSRVNFEMTESTQISPGMRPRLEALQAIGCTLAIDDFGTGFSSLSALVEMPLDYLKIDRSMVRDLDSEDTQVARRARRLINSVIGIADSLRLQCIVEGVETPDQLAHLTGQGVELIQGFIFSGPIPAKDVAAFITRHSRVGTQSD